MNVIFEITDLSVLDAGGNALTEVDGAYPARFSPNPLGSTGELSLLLTCTVIPTAKIRFTLQFVGVEGEYQLLDTDPIVTELVVANGGQVKISFKLRNESPLNLSNYAKLRLIARAVPPSNSIVRQRTFKIRGYY